jgi:hypothetical protein
MKKIMSLVLMIMMLTTVSAYAMTPVTIAATDLGESEAIKEFTKKEDTILTGEYIKYEKKTLYIQLDQYEHETSIYDGKDIFKKVGENYEKGDEVILYVGYGESTFQLIDVLSEDTKTFTGQIKAITNDNYDILSGDIVIPYNVLNTDSNFIENQFVKGYKMDQGTYLMPTIDLIDILPAPCANAYGRGFLKETCEVIC